MNLEALAKKAVDELAVTEAQLRKAEADIVTLRMRRDGLKFTVDYMHGAREVEGDGMHPAPAVRTDVRTVTVRVPARSKKMPSAEISQTDRCESALSALGTEATTAEIRAKADQDGPGLDQEKVRSAMAYLMRQGRVERVAPGVWRLPGVSAPPSPDAVTGTPAMNGAGRG